MTAVVRSFAKLVGVSLMLMLVVPAIARAQNSSGYMQVGDRIYLIIDAPTPGASFADTVTVRQGLVFTVPNVGEVSMNGVRRDSAEAFLKAKVPQFIRNANVRATVLVTVGLFGAVVHPGYVSVPTDKVFRDVLNLNGGMLPTADPSKVTVKRDGKTVMDQGESRAAIAASKTIGELPIRANDIVQIEETSHHSFTTILQLSGILLTTVTLAITLARTR